MDSAGFADALGVSPATFSKLKAVVLLSMGVALLVLHRKLSRHIGAPTASAPLAKTRKAVGTLVQENQDGGQKLRRRRPAVGGALA
jgi:hypothetical protein